MSGDQQRGVERRQRILDAALQVFSRKGYRDAAVDDIADESRTSKGGVYFHFPNKHAIFVALLDRVASLLLERMQAAALAERDPAGRLDAALRTVFRTFGSHRTLARLFLVEAMGAGREFDARMVEVQDAFAAVIKRHLDEAVAQRLIAPIDTGVTSVAWFGAVNQVVTRWVVTGTPAALDDAYPPLRALLLRSVGLPIAAPRVASGIPAAQGEVLTAGIEREGAPNLTAGERSADEVGARGAGLGAGPSPRLAGISMHTVAAARPEIEELRRALGHLAEGIGHASGRVLLSASIRVPWRDPLRLFDAVSGAGGDRSLWQDLTAPFGIAGVGAAWVAEVDATDPGRFGTVGSGWRDVLSTSRIDAPRLPGAGPLAVCGFSFDPAATCARGEETLGVCWRGFPSARLVLPRLALGSIGDESWLTVNVLAASRDDVDAGLDEAARYWDTLGAPAGFDRLDGSAPARLAIDDDLPAETWMRMVAAAASAIRDGQLDKVVLARSVTARAGRPIDVARALRYLRETSSGAGVLLAIDRGDRAFIAATPERLVSLRDGVVRADALAGSAARGRTSGEDWDLAAGLLASTKDQTEHAVVVHYLEAALRRAGAESLAVPATPALRKLSHLQHLHTPITGHVSAGSLLDLAAHLHPTPAVGGSPRETALAYLREHERLDRGWYAGPVGWLDRDGEGEMVVGIRSALVEGATARLFTGCGIVGDSEPAAEFEESRWKLRPMVAALEAS